MSGRLYPSEEHDIYDTIFSEVEKIMGIGTGDNRHLADAEEWKKFFYTCYASTHYSDYAHYDNKITISHGQANPEQAQKIIGNNAYCLLCGKLIYNSRSLYCDECYEDVYEDDEDDNFVMEDCADCGCMFEQGERETFEVNGLIYCENCVTMCEHCGGVFSLMDTAYCEETHEYLCNECYSLKLENIYNEEAV
jgi:hypothetical protein